MVGPLWEFDALGGFAEGESQLVFFHLFRAWKPLRFVHPLYQVRSEQVGLLRLLSHAPKRVPKPLKPSSRAFPTPTSF